MLSLARDQVVVLSCGAGGEFIHSDWGEGPLYAQCEASDQFSVWLEGSTHNILSFSQLGCRNQPVDSNQVVAVCGPKGEASEVEIGFDIRSEEAGVESVTITVCYDTNRSINLWSKHSLWDEISARDHGNDSPPFNPDQYFDFDVNHFYTMVRGMPL